MACQKTAYSPTPQLFFAPKQRRLLADTEVAEDHVQDILDVDPTGQAAQGTDGDAQLLGEQILTAGDLAPQRPPQRCLGILQRPAMTRAGHQGGFGTSQKTLGMTGQSGQKPVKPLARRGR